MPYKFRVILGGLCAFVPTTSRTAVRALMVNTDPAAGHRRVQKLTHVPDLHTPTLLYDRIHEVGGTTKVRAGIPFRFQEVTVTFPSKVASSLSITGPLTGGKSGPSVPGNVDIDWVPDLADVLPPGTIVKVEADCLEPKPGMDLISARVEIDNGTLSVDQFALFQGTEVQAEFVPLPAGAAIQRQALPHRVAWEFDVPDSNPPVPGAKSPFEPVTFRARRFSVSQPVDIVTFQPAAGTTVVEVFLVNLCCGDYFNPTPVSRLADDDDFECFYMLLDNFSTLIKDKPLPIPVGVGLPLVPAAARPTGGGPSGIHCSSCRLAAQ